jgi:broad-specificity NMP kinase
MIIELFGPPGAGKTTFAQALAARLREHGYGVDLILSHRPGERSPRETPSASDRNRRHILPMIGRLARPFGEMLSMARHPSAISRDVRTALALIKIMPPSDFLWLLRLIQYLTRLSRIWSDAPDASRIMLLDQAYVQAVCSLALLSGTTDELPMSQALDQTPKSDLAVLLSAPTEVVQTRLRDRERHASRMERLLELDLATSLKSLAIVECLDDILRKKGLQVAHAASLDERSLRESVERTEAIIVALDRLGSSRRYIRSDSSHSDAPLEASRPQLVRGR